MKTGLTTALTYIMLLCGLAPVAKAVEEPKPKFKTISAAALIPLSGNFSEWGDFVRVGLELAKTRLAEDGIVIDLRYEDTVGDVKTAVTAYNRIKQTGKPTVAFTFGSGIGIALSPLTNQDRVLAMGVATNSNKYRTENDYTFRLCGMVEGEAEYAARFIRQKLNLDAAGVVKAENDYGESAAQLFENDFRKLGGTVELTESVKVGETDLRSLVSKAKSKNVKTIFLPLYPHEAEVFLKQAKEIEYNPEFVVGMASFGASEIFNNKKLIEGKVFIAGDIELATANPHDPRFGLARGTRISDDHITKIAHNQFIAYAYDAMISIGRASQKCPEVVSADCLKEGLYSMEEFQGLSGRIKFDKFGDPATRYTAFRVVDSQLVPQS